MTFQMVYLESVATKNGGLLSENISIQKIGIFLLFF